MSYRELGNITDPKIKTAGFWEVGPIEIDNVDPTKNWLTTKATYDWCSGSGTGSDPYLIENVTINGGGLDCIRIYNSDELFIIRNCTLYNGDTGILLKNVTYARILNNPIESNNNGIILNSSDSNIIESNYIYNNSMDGIYINDGMYNTVYNNSINENAINGIHMLSGFISSFEANNITISKRSIYFVNSDNITIEFNKIFHNVDYGIFFINTNHSNIRWNEINNNNLTALQLEQSRGNIIQYNNINTNARGIILNSSKHCYVLNNNLTQNSDGIHLIKSHENSMTSNFILYNSYGIVLEESTENDIDDNRIKNSGYTGIDMPSSTGMGASNDNDIINNEIDVCGEYGLNILGSGNLVQGNNISNCLNYSVRLTDGPDNIVTINNFIDNNLEGGSQAYDNGIGNHFHCNYWSDWTSPDNPVDGIVDNPYIIDGLANNEDPYPLAVLVTDPDLIDCPPPPPEIPGAPVTFYLLIIAVITISYSISLFHKMNREKRLSTNFRN